MGKGSVRRIFSPFFFASNFGSVTAPLRKSKSLLSQPFGHRLVQASVEEGKLFHVGMPVWDKSN